MTGRKHASRLSCASVQVQSAVPGTMPRLERCIFARNSAKQAGGALRIESVTGELAVSGSFFTDNWACAGGGGISIVSASNVFIRNSLIVGNSAVAHGCVQDSSDMWTVSAGGGILHVGASATNECQVYMPSESCSYHTCHALIGQPFSAPAYKHQCHDEHRSVRRWGDGVQCLKGQHHRWLCGLQPGPP